MDGMTGWQENKGSRLKLTVATGVPANMQPLIREISAFETKPKQQNKGYGASLLNKVCKDADKYQKVLLLRPMPFGNMTLTELQLIQWYERFGFVVIQPEPTLMARKPDV